MFFSNGKALKDAYDEFILSRRATTSAETVKSYIYNFGKRFLPWAGANGIKSLKQIDRRVITAYMAHLNEKGLASRTRETSGKCFKAFMNYAYAEGWISKSVSFKGLIPRARKKEPQVISPEDFLKFVEVADLRDNAMLLLMADSGLRRREVCGLKYGHIDFKGRRIRVVDGKGKEGVAYFGNTAAWALMDWSEVTGWEPETHVFLNIRNMQPLKPAGLSAVFRRLSEQVGIKLTPHGLRRFFCTQAHRNGASVFDLQRMMRHANLEQTRTYTALVDDRIAEAHGKASPMDAMFDLGDDDEIIPSGNGRVVKQLDSDLGMPQNGGDDSDHVGETAAVAN